MEHQRFLIVEITMCLGYDAAASAFQRSNPVSFSIRLLSLPLLTLLSVSISLRAQTPAKATPPKVVRGSVSGRITIKDKPAPGVMVGLRKTIGSTPFLEPFQKAVTDQEGNYRIANVAPGTYDITPAAPAYVIVDGLNMRGKNVVVGEDEEVENINFSLVRGGVITGKVTDAEGRPVIQQQVNLYRANELARAQTQVFPAGNVQTDDRGVYRFFGLVVGQYKVASGRGEGAFGAGINSNRLVYKQVFYPDTPDHLKAKVVDVSEGTEAADVDIKLGRAVQTFTASGRIIYGETQLPAPNFRFALQRFSGDNFQSTEGLASSNAQGDFVIDGLAPGRYGVLPYPNQNSELRAEAAMFDVVDQDVSMITVKLVKGSTLSGVIVFEHEDKKAFAQLLELQLRGQVSPIGATGSIPMQSTTTSISADGSFRLVGLPAGRLNLWLSRSTGGNAPKGFFISRIEHNGVVVPQLQVNDGEQVMGVRVFIGYGTASVRGVVKMDRGVLPEGARMYARLMKPAEPGSPPGNPIAQVMVDARGHFLMDGVPAGVYDVSVSLLATAPGMRPRMVTQPVTVQEGAVSDVSLTLDLGEPKP